MRKRVISMVMSIVMVLSLLAYMPVLEVRAASQADNLFSKAKSQLGVKERSSNSDDIEYNDWFYGRRVHNNGVAGKYAWCAAFVSWCAYYAGISQDIIPKTANTTNMKNGLIERGGVSHIKGTGYQPVRGDIIFFGSNASQHVGIVDYTSGSTVYYIDGNNTQTDPHGVHYSSCSLSKNNLWGFVTPNYQKMSTTGILTNTQICFSKNTYGLQEKLEAALSADGDADYYTVQIWKGSKLVYSGDVSDKIFRIPCSQLGAGDYVAYASSVNKYGVNKSSTKQFKIAEKLSNAQISINGGQFEIGDTIEMAASATGGVDYYNLQIWKGSALVFNKEFTGHTVSVQGSQLGVGDYGAYITGVNASGNIRTKTVHFRIGHPLSNPQISINKNSFKLTDSVKFLASAEGGADYYGLQIWKADKVVYQKKFIGHSIEVLCSQLGEGEYGAFVSCVNGFGSIVTKTVHFKIEKNEYTLNKSQNTEKTESIKEEKTEDFNDDSDSEDVEASDEDVDELESIPIADCKITLVKSQTYTGKARTPVVKVKDGQNRLKKGIDYIVEYKNNLSVGKAEVLIHGKGDYSGTEKKTFIIKPRKMSMPSEKKNKQGTIKIRWNKDAQVTGYEIRYASDKKFKKGKKSIYIKNNKICSKTIKKLKKGQKYYIKIRGYKVIDGKRYYGNYSKVKAVTVKK